MRELGHLEGGGLKVKGIVEVRPELGLDQGERIKRNLGDRSDWSVN